MTDDFLAGLQSDWRSQPGLPNDILGRLGRMRRASIALVAAELACAVIAFATGLWFGAVALATGRLIFAVSAVVLIASTPAFAFASWRARRDVLRWEEETPLGVVRFRRRTVDAALRALTLVGWHVGVVAAFLALIWGIELAGLLGERGFLLIYTGVAIVAGAAAILWLRARRPRLLAERDACDRLLAEFDS